MHPLHAQVAILLTNVATSIVLPRFRNLADSDVIEKTPGELVTIADRESEIALQVGLTALLPGSGVVGEEATAADAGLLDRLDDGQVWVIDPIDGTANFAAGVAPFAIMVALLHDGEREAGWILDPLNNRLCHGWRGHGAWVDGNPLVSKGSGAARLIGGLSVVGIPPDRRAAVEARAKDRIDIVPIPRCAGEQYPRIALGTNDFAMFERTLPWDHAPGALILEEAGGVIRHLDGTEYRVGSRRTGMMAAATPAIWDEAAEVLLT
jgi:fructose-1,6-bisphosphatase/inositol monophosphatase family enzyme